MKKNIFKVGFCVAYDWELLKKSVPRVYERADTICFSIDKNRKSWSGVSYVFDETAFQKFLLEVDVEKKIRVYEDDFALPNLSPIENDNRQRNLMGKYMGEGGWHIQIDSDEYFLDFKGFTEYLCSIHRNPLPTQKPINVSVGLIPLIKKLDTGYIYIQFDKNIETAPFATNQPIYRAARRNEHFNHIGPFIVIHETWARAEQELYHKIQNWGHRDDFNKESYFKIWQSIDEYNYLYVKDFHPIEPSVWPALGYCKGSSIDEFITNFSVSFPLSKFQLFLKNNRNIARLKHLFTKLLG